jgi:hypothetical protein
MGVQGAKSPAGARGVLALFSPPRRASGPPKKIMSGSQALQHDRFAFFELSELLCYSDTIVSPKRLSLIN